MSQTSHVRAIISIGTAYKDCCRRDDHAAAGRKGEGRRARGDRKRIVIQRRAEVPARGPARETRDLNVKRAEWPAIKPPRRRINFLSLNPRRKRARVRL